MAAIDRDDAAGHVGAGVGGQQEQRAVEFARLAQAAAAERAGSSALAGIAGEERVVKVRLDIAGRERVDPNAVPRPLQCEAPWSSAPTPAFEIA